MRRLVAAAALVALLPLAAAQPTTPTPADNERAYAAAQAEYDRGHYSAAFVAFATLADAGHVESARVAIQMHHYALGLYQQRFAAGPKQIGRWTTMLSCRKHAASPADACVLVSSGAGRSAASAPN